MGRSVNPPLQRPYSPRRHVTTTGARSRPRIHAFSAATSSTRPARPSRPRPGPSHRRRPPAARSAHPAPAAPPSLAPMPNRSARCPASHSSHANCVSYAAALTNTGTGIARVSRDLPAAAPAVPGRGPSFPLPAHPAPPAASATATGNTPAPTPGHPHRRRPPHGTERSFTNRTFAAWSPARQRRSAETGPPAPRPAPPQPAHPQSRRCSSRRDALPGATFSHSTSTTPTAATGTAATVAQPTHRLNAVSPCARKAPTVTTTATTKIVPARVNPTRQYETSAAPLLPQPELPAISNPRSHNHWRRTHSSARNIRPSAG